MKNLLISLTITLIVCTLSGTASAEPLEKNVVRVTVKNMKSGQQLFDSGTQETPKPFTTLRKACPGNQKRECLYRITGKNERKLYEFTADEMIMVSYTYQTAVVELP